MDTREEALEKAKACVLGLVFDPYVSRYVSRAEIVEDNLFVIYASTDSGVQNMAKFHYTGIPAEGRLVMVQNTKDSMWFVDRSLGHLIDDGLDCESGVYNYWRYPTDEEMEEMMGGR